MNRTFFSKNFTAYASIVFITLLLATMVFVNQIDTFSHDQKKTQLTQLTHSMASLTEFVLGNYSTQNDSFFQLSMLRTAADNDVEIILTDAKGNLTIGARPDGLVTFDGYRLPPEILTATIESGLYEEFGTMGGLLTETSYVAGAPCRTAYGNASALIFVSASSRQTAGVTEKITHMFLLIVTIALIGILLMTYFISSRMTRPLKTMANAARQFAEGDFAVRVSEDNRCDEIDELAQSFNNMAGGLEQLEELTRGFIGNVSHEFKTPMTTIGGFVDGMLDGTITPEQHQKYLTIISEEVHRLSRMVIRMLDAAKIQSGELILALAPFDFTEMSSQIILSFEQKINAKHIDVAVDFSDQLIVMGDRDHVFRAVYNLVDNAVKFIDDGGMLTLRAQEAEGMCAFSLINTGAGIPPEDIPHIFDRFYKADPSRSRDRSGAGLGLYIVKNIINLHGGDISVRSGEGETEFSFVLPLAQRKKNAPKLVENGDLTMRS